MTKTYAQVRTEMTGEKPGRDGWDDAMPCRVCRGNTTRRALAGFGERCFPCFRAYCAEAGDAAPQPFNPGDMSPRAYLRARLSTWEQRHGQRLTKAQADTLAALGGSIEQQEAAW